MGGGVGGQGGQGQPAHSFPISVPRGTLGALSCVTAWPRASSPMDQKMRHLHGPILRSQVSCTG